MKPREQEDDWYFAMLAPHESQQFQRIGVQGINPSNEDIRTIPFDEANCRAIVCDFFDVMAQRLQHRGQ
jgi:hypothetical protein